MIDVMGKKYLTKKEASKRYGYSEDWFNKKRAANEGPKCIQIKKPGRVLYPLEETDLWFKERMKIYE